MMFIYRTRFGTFSIRPDAGRWVLCMNDEALGSYHSPESAADDVFMCATTFDAWDSQGTVHEPESLAEWERR
ncbi:hypothetical protein [Solidesulfovibrio fructosivorans]|uniref:hypothetical protein n=1 Tax=Solidesulfovibrio fructosivorans TaxID=878 RepID=UPI0005C1521D|nr:hypothetical protein [Solidesulfovibrio fructosivorans]